MALDMFRLLSKGQYDTDFSFLNYNSKFPSAEVQGRNAIYRFRHKQYTGEYANNKNLITQEKIDQLLLGDRLNNINNEFITKYLEEHK